MKRLNRGKNGRARKKGRSDRGREDSQEKIEMLNLFKQPKKSAEGQDYERETPTLKTCRPDAKPGCSSPDISEIENGDRFDYEPA